MDARIKQLFGLVAALIAVAAAIFGVTGAGASTPGRARLGSAARLPQGAKLTGSLPASTPIQLSIALQPRDPAGLQAFANAVSTPGSAQYHHYLTVSQFANRFGATPAAIAAVQRSLRTEGLSVQAPMANHLTMLASGSTAQVEHAFATKLSQVKLANGKSAYANTSAPTIAPNIAPDVQGVIGFNNFPVEQPEGLQRPTRALRPRAVKRQIATGGPQPCSDAQAEMQSSGGYTADYVAAAYNFSGLYGAGDTGSGQTVALFELEPYSAADIAAYQSCYQTHAAVTPVLVGTAPTGSDDTEAALDIENITGIAPSANVLVYEAANGGTGPIQEYATIVSQDRAKVISSSWGGCEYYQTNGGTDRSLIDAENSIFQEAAAQGQSLYIASGDAGSTACNQANTSNTSLSVQDPSSQPYATGVGGTNIYNTSGGGVTLWAPGEPLSQGIWNDGVISGKASATTGGVSSDWTMPSYQAGAAGAVGVINSNSSGSQCGAASGSYCREVPDVSALGDPDTGYDIYANGSWRVVGGTSAAAPLWAAFTALSNASARCRGIPVGFVNPALYRLASTAYASNLADVDTASFNGATDNDPFDTTTGLYPVAAGYDMATGLGTPVSVTLANSLCTGASPAYAISVSNPGTQKSTVGRHVSVTIHASDAGHAKLAYAASGLPAGLSINSSTGVISGTTSKTQTTTVTVAAEDAYHNVGSTKFTWKVGSSVFASVKSLKVTGVGKRKPRISFKVSASSGSAKLKQVWISLPKGFSLGRSKKGITVRNGGKVKFSSKRRGRKLTITLKSAQRAVVVTLSRPSLSVSKSLAKKVKKRKVKKLNFTVGARNTRRVQGSVRVRVGVS
jgi:subtilase family serine protease